MKLRTQILLISLVLLIGLPLAAWFSVRLLETQLRQQQADTLIGAASTAARAITTLPAPGQSLYVHQADRPIILDGYAGDWQPWLEQAPVWGDGDTRVKFVAARGEQGLYLLFDVDSPAPVPAAMGPGGLLPGDHVRLSFQDHRGLRELVISSFAPGPVDVATGSEPGDIRVHGQWQARRGGWTLELQVRPARLPERLGFAVVHVADDEQHTEISRLGPPRPLTLTASSPDLQAQLVALTGIDVRAWLTDAQGFVLARTERSGHALTSREDIGRLPAWFYEYVIADTLPQGPRRGGDRLDSPEVEHALAGRAHTWWHTVPERPGITLVAAAPVRTGSTVSGTVVLEQTGNTSLLMANRALLTFFALALAIFGLVVLMLLVFAAYFTVRIRRLKTAAEQAVGSDGRVRAEISTGGPRDEIGDLRRATAGLLERLREQQDYLRTLADKLAHELRTPLATIRSSLENLNQADSFTQAARYRARAREGMNRLSQILHSMGQASRLEESLKNDRPEPVDLAQLVGDYVTGCRDLHPDHHFGLEVRSRPGPISGSPELIAQLLDKLTENAVDFSPPGSTIHYRLNGTADGAELEVENTGPKLPEAMRGQLFESMVSVREKRSEGVHLGLGLYIARLIAQHHGGGITARDTARGVAFTVSFKR